MRGRQKVLSLNILDYTFFHNLYISKTCIYYRLLWVGWSAPICGYHRLGYHIFTDANEKYINVSVMAFTKSDATKPHFGKSSYRHKKFHATTSLIQILLALVHQIIPAQCSMMP